MHSFITSASAAAVLYQEESCSTWVPGGVHPGRPGEPMDFWRTMPQVNFTVSESCFLPGA